MTKKNLNKWVTALRSGKYIQGECSLAQVKEFEYYRYPCFCPLGVFAHKVDGVAVPVLQNEAFLSEDRYEIPKSIQHAIAAMNDNLELSFKAIAYILEHHYNELHKFGRVDKKGKYDVKATRRALRAWAPIRKLLAAKNS